jgi:chromosome partitioning protein
MTDFVIACLSQKGGVGKSTIARLVARTYASAGWSVKICDFNTRQLTAVDWVALRMDAKIEPAIDAQPMAGVKKFKNEPYDLLVIDGAPDSDLSSLDAARVANLVIIPTGLTVDDLKPQMAFAYELMAKGIERAKILFVLNKTTDSEAAVREATALLKGQGFSVAETDLSTKTGYQIAQNVGYAVSETKFPSLNDRAEALANEIVTKMNSLTPEIAA